MPYASKFLGYDEIPRVGDIECVPILVDNVREIGGVYTKSLDGNVPALLLRDPSLKEENAA